MYVLPVLEIQRKSNNYVQRLSSVLWLDHAGSYFSHHTYSVVCECGWPKSTISLTQPTPIYEKKAICEISVSTHAHTLLYKVRSYS